MPLTVPEVVEIAINGTQTGKQWTNVLHVRRDRPILGGDAGDVAQVTLDAFVEHFVPLMSELVTITGADYVDLDNAEGSTGTRTPTPPLVVTGGDTAQPVPINTAVLVRKNTEGGRTTRGGRMYLVGMAEVNVDGAGIIASVTRTAWQDAAEAFLDELNNESGSFVVVSRPETGDVGESNDVTGLSVSTVAATQRERMRR